MFKMQGGAWREELGRIKVTWVVRHNIDHWQLETAGLASQSWVDSYSANSSAPLPSPTVPTPVAASPAPPTVPAPIAPAPVAPAPITTPPTAPASITKASQSAGGKARNHLKSAHGGTCPFCHQIPSSNNRTDHFNHHFRIPSAKVQANFPIAEWRKDSHITEHDGTTGGP
ncbi:hypothetical protein L208DRAFT_1374321 [Tricholoma matsutake]|nr:hypothetical protein L208DRAFT_1374321 [Tricholoma matsutake 945]